MLGREDSSWTLDDDVRYDPWGNLLEHGGTAPSALTQGWGVDAAYQQDGDTGLTLMGNRYYDPTIGRFLSQDPSGDGDNWYEYADNDPLAEEDPAGLTPASINGGDGDWIGGLMSGSGYEGEGGGASFDLYLTRWDENHDGQWSATWSLPIWAQDIGPTVDKYALFGLAGKAGAATGYADGGYGSRAKAVGLTAAAIGVGVAQAVTLGRASTWARAGLPFMKIFLARGTPVHILYGVGDSLIHGDNGVVGAAGSVASFYRWAGTGAQWGVGPVFAFPVLYPSAVMQTGQSCSSCLAAAAMALLRGVGLSN